MVVTADSKIASVSPADGYKVVLSYETGEKRLFDVSPYIEGDWFGELADQGYFRQVKVESGFRDFIVWPHGQDIAPHDLAERGIPLKG
ncbi:MAG: DUF2442 domain-containing protein [Slackia sp.]|nr:DUF2442 domain-containing protein [Slackia sp.]